MAYDLGDGASVGRIDATVFSVGWNTKYLVAARHPYSIRSKTEYYYLIRALDAPYEDPDVSVRGPFDDRAFSRERGRLKLPGFQLEIESMK